jgi:hypothetical protein
MNRQDIAEQTMVENGLLRTIMEGIRTTTAWKVKGTDLTRKLTTLRFICQSLQRHLDHLLTLEEFDGYMDFVRATRPEFTRTVEALRLDHDNFRDGIRRLVHRLERASPADTCGFVDICADTDDFLTKIEAHTKTETKLLQEAFARAEGGEA